VSQYLLHGPIGRTLRVERPPFGGLTPHGTRRADFPHRTLRKLTHSIAYAFNFRSATSQHVQFRG